MELDNPGIPLPKSWTTHVRSAVLHVISFAQFATAYSRGRAANSVNARIRLKAALERANQEIAQLREEIRIKDARMARINPHRRPHCPPTERLAILELKAARCWTLEQTARTFHVMAATIASWTKRVDEEGSGALVQLREPVNKFPDFVRYVVQRLRVLCPTMGKVKIAQTLARAGLHVSATTVGRMLKDKPVLPPTPAEEAKTTDHVVTSKYPNHVWLVDLTLVQTGSGFWCSWLPFALPQRWPFCHWVAVVIAMIERVILTAKQLLRLLPLMGPAPRSPCAPTVSFRHSSTSDCQRTIHRYACLWHALAFFETTSNNLSCRIFA